MNMENGCMNCTGNIYRACREEAAKYNDKLKSRESAAELLGISTSTMSNYELGITKTVPVDIVVMMADLYNSPQIKNLYCKRECPIGKQLPVATEIDTLAGVTVRLLNDLDDKSVQDMKRQLLNIAADGKIDDSEKEEFEGIMGNLDALVRTISELRMLAEKYVERSGHNGTC